MIRGNRKLSLKMRESHFKQQAERRSMVVAFARWYRQHRDLTAKFDAVNMRHRHLLKVNAFDNWLGLARRSVVDTGLISKLTQR